VGGSPQDTLRRQWVPADGGNKGGTAEFFRPWFNKPGAFFLFS